MDDVTAEQHGPLGSAVDTHCRVTVWQKTKPRPRPALNMRCIASNKTGDQCRTRDNTEIRIAKRRGL
jgi:hypothetical protein